MKRIALAFDAPSGSHPKIVAATHFSFLSMCSDINLNVPLLLCFEPKVVLGTSLGLLYALDARTGFVLEGWPLQLGPIEAQVDEI